MFTLLIINAFMHVIRPRYLNTQIFDFPRKIVSTF